MARLTPLHLVPALLAAATHGAEITVEQRPFILRHSFAANALPGKDGMLLELTGRIWTDYKIAAIAPHGAQLAKGEPLVSFQADEIEKKLHDSRRKVSADTLALQQAELELSHLIDTASHKLNALRLAAETASEENEHFVKIKRKAKEESAAQSLKRTKQLLGNQQEELNQLTKMYEADDLTEETEEIILLRQQDAVASAEFALRMEMLNHQRTLEVLLPREAQSLADSERDTALALKKAEVEIPRSVEIKKLELEGLKTALAREKANLADLETDRAGFEFKAPAEGWFYYGPIRDGRWTPAEVAKTLFVNGAVAPKKAFATFIPSSARLRLVAFPDAATARSIGADAFAHVTVPGREDLEIPAKLVSLSSTPEPDGTFRADLAATWPEGFSPVPGTAAQVNLVAYHQPAAVVVPNKALTFGTLGWTVDVKLADGKTEPRAVKRGRVSGEETEILSGLEVGQVIVVP